MNRREAIDMLVEGSLGQLSTEDRLALLLDWWAIDSTDPEYDTLPDSLKSEIARSEGPADPNDALYDALLEVALRRSYVGVVNSYLKEKIFLLGREEDVEGIVETLEACPCCGYRTLTERGEYEICPVCFWEDDGTTETDRVSGPNHMTLREAQLNFSSFGAVTKAARTHVLADGTERYAR